MVSIAADAWHFLDIVNRKCLQVMNVGDSRENNSYGNGNISGNSSNNNTNSNNEYSSGTFHPDGLILGTGTTSGLLRVWDVRAMQNVQTLVAPTANGTGSSGASLTSICFSENGYLAASGAEDGSVHLWDLRKLASTKSLDCK